MKNAEPKCLVPKAIGTHIVVEILSPDEAYNSIIYVPDNAKLPAMHGYILDIGPALKGEDWGIKIGDRVIVWGEFTPIPRHKDDPNKRKMGAFQPHSLKVVFPE